MTKALNGIKGIQNQGLKHELRIGIEEKDDNIKEWRNSTTNDTTLMQLQLQLQCAFIQL